MSFSRTPFQKQRESRQAEYMLSSVLGRIYIEMPHITLQAVPFHRTVAPTHTVGVRSSPCSPYVGACQCYDAQRSTESFPQQRDSWNTQLLFVSRRPCSAREDGTWLRADRQPGQMMYAISAKPCQRMGVITMEFFKELLSARPAGRIFLFWQANHQNNLAMNVCLSLDASLTLLICFFPPCEWKTWHSAQWLQCHETWMSVSASINRALLRVRLIHFPLHWPQGAVVVATTADRLHRVSDYTSERFLNLLQATAVKQDTDVNVSQQKNNHPIFCLGKIFCWR